MGVSNANTTPLPRNKTILPATNVYFDPHLNSLRSISLSNVHVHGHHAHDSDH